MDQWIWLPKNLYPNSQTTRFDLFSVVGGVRDRADGVFQADGEVCGQIFVCENAEYLFYRDAGGVCGQCVYRA